MKNEKREKKEKIESKMIRYVEKIYINSGIATAGKEQ